MKKMLLEKQHPSKYYSCKTDCQMQKEQNRKGSSDAQFDESELSAARYSDCRCGGEGYEFVQQLTETEIPRGQKRKGIF